MYYCNYKIHEIHEQPLILLIFLSFSRGDSQQTDCNSREERQKKNTVVGSRTVAVGADGQQARRVREPDSGTGGRGFQRGHFPEPDGGTSAGGKQSLWVSQRVQSVRTAIAIFYFFLFFNSRVVVSKN